MSRWYYTTDNKQRLGPITTEQLRQLILSGTIRPQHMLMREDSGKWIQAGKVKGLFPTQDRSQAGHAEASSPGATTAPAKSRRKGPIIALAGCLALVLVLCGGGGIAGFLFRDWIMGQIPPDERPTANAGNPGKESEKPVSGAKDGQPGAPGTDAITVDLQNLYSTFWHNEAEADAKYLKKKVQFTTTFFIGGVEKDDAGRYYAWLSMNGASRQKYLHLIFRFRNVSDAASIKPPNTYSIRGVCAGKQGEIDTFFPASGLYGVDSSKKMPSLVFNDCELIEKPTGNPVNEVRQGDSPIRPPVNPPDSGIIKDPEKARLKARFLMNQIVFETDGQLSGNRRRAEEILEEIIRTCPDTYEAKKAKKLLKHVERMKEALSEKGTKDGKPLDLAQIVARESAQRKELRQSQRAGNANATAELGREHAVERARWNGKPVKGQAEVAGISGSEAVLVVKIDERNIRTIRAVVKGKDDPIFDKLKRGDVVNIQGVLEYRYNPLGGDITIKDCVFTANPASP